MLEGRIQKTFNFGKGRDFVEFARDFGSPHPKNRTTQINIFAAGQFRMKAGTDLERLPIRPRIRANPSVGFVMRARTLSSVLLPAPFRPISPATCPSGNF